MTATTMCRSVLRPAALLAVLAVGGCSRPSLEGTWVGRDERGATVVYSFGSNGTGYRSVGALREDLAYRVRTGYPNLIEITIGGPGGPQTTQGLVELFWDGRVKLEMGTPGGPAPTQVSPNALVLSQPATK